jgi:hypothetical protein
MTTILNLQGTKYEINEYTLEKIDYFEALLKRWPRKEIVIDRCPVSFKYILDFLIYGKVDPKATSDPFMKMKIISDIDFYGVSGIFDEVYNGPYFQGSIDKMECSIEVLNACSIDGNKKTLAKVLESIGEISGKLNSMVCSKYNHPQSKELFDLDLSDILEYAVEKKGIISMWGYMEERKNYITGECYKSMYSRAPILDGKNMCGYYITDFDS